MNILLRDFDAEVVREDIFRSTTGNENLYQISYGNGIRVVKFAACKNLTLRSTMLPHRIIHTYTYLDVSRWEHP
jgi:hypothetical protein